MGFIKCPRNFSDYQIQYYTIIMGQPQDTVWHFPIMVLASFFLFFFVIRVVIHAFFSFFLNWSEYMPFWNIPYIKTLIY